MAALPLRGLRALPIGAGWRDSAFVIATDLARTTPLAAVITVTGEEPLLTTAGTYDCWIVTLGTDMGQTQYWISKADRIVVVDRGQVVDVGRHSDLVRRDGLYARLAELQFNLAAVAA